jgi:predicted Zn-dependent protease
MIHQSPIYKSLICKVRPHTLAASKLSVDKLIRFALCLVVLATASFAGAWEQGKEAANNANDDPVLQAMRTEMERSKTALKLGEMGPPYYIDYRVSDGTIYNAEAAYGALRSNTRFHSRLVRVVVRVGDYQQDSFFGSGQGVIDFMSLDDDLVALRHQLWLATDRAYKNALEALTAKKAQLKQFTIDQPVDDFAKAEPIQSIQPLAKIEFDPDRWNKLLKSLSALFKNDLEVQYFDSSLQFSAVNRYFVNSEGTVTRGGQTIYEIAFAGSTQASDGMRLDRSHTVIANKMNELPSEAELKAQATKLLGTFKELRTAPVVAEEYHGPVLFSGDAASSVFATLVGENVLGRKPELGQPARAAGAYGTNYKTRVLPEFLSVVDDPTIFALDGRPLLGGYTVDDEGVKAMRVSVIENGKLVNYIMGREPIRDFPASNGHGRARAPINGPGPSLGNMIVRSAHPVSPKELKERLIKLCQERDLPYGYYVETMGPSLTPRLLYKVWVKDGHEELVRGAAFGNLDTRSLRDNLIAAGDDVNIENLPLNIPHSIVNPSILFDELEVKRANARSDKLPDYAAPALTSSK